MKCWKCGSHMSRHNGIASCDRCGRSVSYKTNSQSSGSGSLSSDSLSSGCVFGCLAGCLALTIKYVLIGGLILAGIVVLVIAIGIAWIFITW